LNSAVFVHLFGIKYELLYLPHRKHETEQSVTIRKSLRGNLKTRLLWVRTYVTFPYGLLCFEFMVPLISYYPFILSYLIYYPGVSVKPFRVIMAHNIDLNSNLCACQYINSLAVLQDILSEMLIV
jgi:hypothetical protein